MKIIAISGWKGSGKDTAANILIDDFGFTRIGFADKLKDNVAEAYRLNRKSLDDQSLKELPIKEMPVQPRDKFSQTLTEFMFREFKTSDGIQPVNVLITNGAAYGETSAGFFPLYWTRRALCILEGSTKRTSDPDYWVNIAVKEAKSRGAEAVVISDLRYKNELSALKIALNPDDSLVTIRVNRFDNSPSSDPSERDLDDAEFDYTISNQGTLEDFMNKVKTIALKISEVK